MSVENSAFLDLISFQMYKADTDCMVGYRINLPRLPSKPTCCTCFMAHRTRWHYCLRCLISQWIDFGAHLKICGIKCNYMFQIRVDLMIWDPIL